MIWTEDSRTVLGCKFFQRRRQRNRRLSEGMARSRPIASMKRQTGIGHIAAGPGGLLAVESDYRPDKSRTAAKPEPAANPDVIDPANGISLFAHLWAGRHHGLHLQSFRHECRLDREAGRPGAPVMLFDAGTASLFRVNFSPGRLAHGIV